MFINFVRYLFFMKNFLLITFLFLFVSAYPCNHDNFIDKNEVRYFKVKDVDEYNHCLLYTSPSPRDRG